MGAAPLTAAAIMSYTQNLEDRSAALYQELAQRFPEQGKQFSGYAADCEKFKTQLTRTYQETVTDALETNYAFEGMVLPDSEDDTQLGPDASLREAVEKAMGLEDEAIAYYLEVAERSRALLATIPGAFGRIARRRRRRREALASLIV